ncbi:hypothetical protein WL57_18875 [Burkholderia cepacia]|uniref:hypothetical protein n=1 Tax=Burkholderia cepacia TaxID=292 RepID=UPI0007575719|nr:hypothetical protein [Burkholderia cepacia]KVQ24127.1 hypothetical protein WK01_24885 [Burkholderia cepacia]KWC84768.1 hypothetical protein WL57_18875 [Burkholderia cepacia]KWI50914.1 hypothetical protein WM06_17180 [Burkholderia cepacia]
MTQKAHLAHASYAAALTATLLLAACGGGGGGDSGTSSTPASNLSTAQQNYESFALAGNGGLHYLHAQLSISTSSSGSVSVGQGSYFYTEDQSLAQSPSGGPQLLTKGLSSVSASLPVPTVADQRYVVNGAIVTSTQEQVSYSGANVQLTDLAADGHTAAMTVLGTNYTVVPLSGAIASSPAELFSDSALGIITNTINGTSLYNKQATWQSGAAYMKVTRQVVGDTVLTGDCAAPQTTGPTPTPCSATASTLEAFFPYTNAADNKTYNLSDGQIVTLAGARAWVANAALNTPTAEYRVFYQNNGQIDVGAVIRDGTTLAIAPAGSTTPQNFYILLNSAAIQSVKTAIAF